MSKTGFILFFFSLLSVVAKAQFFVTIFENDMIVKTFKSNDSVHAFIELKRFQKEFQNKGYIEATIDSFYVDSNSVTAYFFKGQKFYWKQIIITSADSVFDFYSDFKKLENQSVNFSQLDDLINKTVFKFSCSGYPFAQINLSNFTISDSLCSADFYLNKGRKIVFDSVYFSNKVDVTAGFLANYLDFRKGKIYSEQTFNDVDVKLSALDFISIERPSEVEFHQKSVDLYLYLKNRKSNSFSGLIGFSNANEKFSLIGEANIKLQNVFKIADNTNISWQKTKDKSQNLNVDFSLPYLLGTNIGVYNSFEIKKVDSSYVNVCNNAGLSYYLSSFNRTSVFVDYRTSVVFDTLSTLSSFTTTMYGISADFKKLNNSIMHSKGYIYGFSAGTGKKQFADSVSNVFNVQQNFEIFIPVYKKIVFYYRNFFYFLNSDYQTENELFKFGGANLMRGFNEEDLIASFLNINSLEIKYLVENRLDVFVFADYSLMQYKTIYQDFWNHPVGVGGGVRFMTESGLISIAYAVGKDDFNSFLLKNSKLHFGIVTYF